MKKISVIVPCYNEQEAVPFFYEEMVRVEKSMQNYSFELIFVNDGSKDNTINVVRELAAKDEQVKFIDFSRNFVENNAEKFEILGFSTRF